MTVDEIKRELDDLGVEYPKDALKAELEQLLAEAAEDAATGPETSEPDRRRRAQHPLRARRSGAQGGARRH